MPRVVPSQVVAFIATLRDYRDNPTRLANMNRVGAARLSSILDLVAEVPTELLTMDNPTYAEFILAKARIRTVLANWIADANANAGQRQVNFGAPNDPVAAIRDALSKCPDESPTPATSELTFITHTALRTNLRNDMGAVNRALSNGEWKAATVLAGSVIEALLLWALQQRPAPDITTAITALRSKGTLGRQPNAHLERWDLHEYTETAAHLGVIEPDTATETRLAKEFRNLIHPGRVQRLAQECDRGTALSCVAALEHVVRDLS
jgi:hypothetical protein